MWKDEARQCHRPVSVWREEVSEATSSSELSHVEGQDVREAHHRHMWKDM
jgi:hypothetical protein